MRRYVLWLITPLVLASIITGLAEAGLKAAANIANTPLVYSGLGFPKYKGVKTFSEYIPMSDGEKLAADIYLPTDGPERSAFPVILDYTPYRRAKIDPGSGEIFDKTGSRGARFFLSYGYARVCVDIRGTGASTGWLMDFMPQIGRDGKELVDWIAEQPWCDGNVGMYGGSYIGWSQTAVASQEPAPAALKCIVPTVIPLDGYSGQNRPGGIYLGSQVDQWSVRMYRAVRNYYLPDKREFPTKPVVDEDGDGDLADEIPVDVNGNGTFLDDGFPPKYRDGAQREHIYYKATLAHHEGNHDVALWAPGLTFIDAKSPLGLSYYELGANAHVRGLMKSGIPVCNIGGWFDRFARGTFELYCTLRSTNPTKLLIFPGYHGSGGPFWEVFGDNEQKGMQTILFEHLRYFDRYLKGIQNGVDTEPPIKIYVMHGGGWRQEREWPLERQVMTRYYFSQGNQLVTQRAGGGSDTYTADFTHNSRYGTNQCSRWYGPGGKGPDQVPTRTEKDKQCLVYTSEPLAENTEVTGHPIVRFWVSSTADYGDFFVYLEDVDEKGEAVLVTETQLRAGFADLYDNDRSIAGGKYKIDVLPDLPWHGYEKSQYRDGILADNAVVELVIDFLPTSWVFRKGHRIRVSIACADYPTFQLHPELSPANDPEHPDNIVPTITVYRDATHPSHVDLPVIPTVGDA
jgi:predicted acyl esterase